MYKYDGEAIPEITRHTTPTEAEGIRNARKLRDYVEEGLESNTLPTYRGTLNRKALAKLVGFGRSAYQQNQHIENVTVWAEKQLGQKKKKGNSGAGSTDKEKELAAEVSRLQNRNIALKTQINDAEKILRGVGYVKKKNQDGKCVYVCDKQALADGRLPWEDDGTRMTPLFSDMVDTDE